MSGFGWSYPPGAADDPFAPYNQDDPPCDVCGGFPEVDCLCPECPVCGQQGNPNCYKPKAEGGCGLETSAAQAAQLERKLHEWEEARGHEEPPVEDDGI